MNTVDIEEMRLLKAELERVKAENAALKEKEKGAISFKVSEKGAVSIYGLGRFPITAYRSQWDAILERADDLKKFMHENRDRLAEKASSNKK